MKNAKSGLGSGRYALDAAGLTRKGARVALAGLPLRILTLIMAREGALATRSELKQALWPGTERIDTERRLNTAVRALRAALGEDADLVETVRGMGYRWRGGRQRAPASRFASWRLSLVAVALLLLGGGFAPHTPAPLSAALQGRFAAIAALGQSNPSAASALLPALITERPDFAPAHMLAAELAVRVWRAAPSAETMARAEAALDGARTGSQGEAQLDALAAEVALRGARDWRRAEQLYQRALARDPENAEARGGFAWLLANSDRQHAALAHAEVLMAGGALSESQRADLGWLVLRLRRADLALALCDPAGARNINLLTCRQTALARTGALSEARDAGIALMQAAGANGREQARVRAGAPERGLQAFLEWRATKFLPPEGHWFQRAQVQAEAGWDDDALSSLERAAASQDPSLFKLPTTREFDRFRRRPRFQAIALRI